MGEPTCNLSVEDGGELQLSVQRRNTAVFVATNGLLYLAAPVVYIGLTHATLCNALGATDLVANLPSSAAFWAGALPLAVVWRFHRVGHIRPVLVAGYSASALAALGVAGALYAPVTPGLRIASVILCGGVIGGALAVINTFVWEQIARGIGPTYRGIAYTLAFGFGPLLAVAGSLMQQLLLAGTLELPWMRSAGAVTTQFSIPALAFPLNFAALFAMCAVILGTCAIVATRYVTPRTDKEIPRTPILQGQKESGVGVLRDRVLLAAIIAYLLIDAGGTIVNNMALYTPTALGHPAEDFAGYQNTLRFLFKVFVGIVLGWSVTRHSPKVGLLMTVGLCLGGVLWVFVMPSKWFLISFGLMGAGELYGVYFPNYIMNRSKPERIRQNMALLQLLCLATALAPPFFGFISDRYSLLASFFVASGMMGVALLLVLALPSRPEQSDEVVTLRRMEAVG